MPKDEGALPTLSDEGTEQVLGAPTAKGKSKTNVNRVAVLGLIVLGCVSAVGGLVLYQRHRHALKMAEAEAQPKGAAKSPTLGAGAFNEANKPVESMSIGRKKAELLKQEDDNQKRIAAISAAAGAGGGTPGGAATAFSGRQDGSTPSWRMQGAAGAASAPGGAAAVGGGGRQGGAPGAVATVTPRERKLGGDVLAFGDDRRTGGGSGGGSLSVGAPRYSPTGVPDVRQQAYQQAYEQEMAQHQPELARGAAPGGGGAVPGGTFGSGAGAGGGGSDALSQRLKPAVVDARAAGRLPDLDWLLARGQTIPCVLRTGIDTTLPGFVTCKVMSDVRSANGKNVLIERGSMGIGEQQSSLRPGQARTFALWDRIATPGGIFVELDSPATDQMGMSGIPGYVDNHFWERFGGAIMVSLIKDYTTALVQRELNSANGGTTYVNTTQSGADIATETLKNTINIPPTLVVNPGTVVYMTVARDISFQNVYEVVR
jgi:type IV secretion system protein VirB10